MGSIKMLPISRMAIPKRKLTRVKKEKSSRASLSFPSPNFFAIKALPPVESMMPTAKTILITGYTILAADRALVPNNLEIKMPSTMEYKDIKIIITIVGKAKRSREKNLKSFAIEFDIQITPCKILSKRYNKV